MAVKRFLNYSRIDSEMMIILLISRIRWSGTHTSYFSA